LLAALVPVRHKAEVAGVKRDFINPVLDANPLQRFLSTPSRALTCPERPWGPWALATHIGCLARSEALEGLDASDPAAAQTHGF